MASFQGKIGWKRPKIGENKNYCSVPTGHVIKNSKKMAKKFKKLKNTIMASFKARIGWKMPRKKENKYCRSVSFLLNA